MSSPKVSPPALKFEFALSGPLAQDVQISQLPSSAKVTAAVTVDQADLLVVGIDAVTVFDQDSVVDDPVDLPPGHPHTPEIIPTLREVGKSDGSTPLTVSAKQVLKVSLKVNSVRDAFAQTSGVLQIVGDSWDPIFVPVSFVREGFVQCSLAFSEMQAVQGAVVTIPASVRYGGGPSVQVSFDLVTDGDAQGISLDPLALSIDPGQAKRTNLILHVAGDCTVGTKDLRLRQLGGFSQSLTLRLNVIPAPPPPPDLAKIRQRMVDKYTALGGFKSVLGLPITETMPVEPDGSGFRMLFRGGHLHLGADAAEPVEVQQQAQFQLWWVGLECQIRQEAEDEIYGVLGLLVPGTALSDIRKFPDDDAGVLKFGRPSERLINTDTLLFQGPPFDIVLSLSLFEHDSGPTSAIKAKIADTLAKATDALATALGLPAEALAATDGWANDLSLGLINAVASALGVGDDQYNPGKLSIRWEEIQANKFQQATRTHPGDPHTVTYTHSLVVTGTDDGGDTGQYVAYFNVHPQTVSGTA